MNTVPPASIIVHTKTADVWSQRMLLVERQPSVVLGDA